MKKKQILKKFLKENPEFSRYTLSRLPKKLTWEQKLEKKTKILLQIARLRFKNNARLSEIAKITGLSEGDVNNRITRYLR